MLRLVLDLGFCEHLIPEVEAQFLGSAQIHFAPSKEPAQFLFHAHHGEQSGHLSRLKFHQHVHIAIGAKIGAQH